MIEVQGNGAGIPDGELDITVEEDEGVFLGVGVETGDGRRLDWYTTDRGDIEEFFRMVEQAKADYEKFKADGKV